MMATVDVSTGATVAAAALAFSFGGVTLEHFALGCGCYMVGASGRFGLKISKSFEKQERPNWGSAIGALSISPFLAAFASMSLFFAAHLAGFEGDAAIGLILVLTALKGPDGIDYLQSLVSRAVPQKLGNLPTNQEPKP